MTTLRSGAVTDVGRVRKSNQDWMLATDSLFAVADGLGGHRGGEVASQTAIEVLQAAFESDPTASGLADAVHKANRAVWKRGRKDSSLRGMGTTITAAAAVQSTGNAGLRMALVNVGDSRAYHFHEDSLSQLTSDHSLVEELVHSGQLSVEEAAYSPSRHILTRALGIEPVVEVDTLELRPSAGDRILLCSDGLVNEVSDAEIASLLGRLEDPQEAARQLVQIARAHGGSDNITVVVVDVGDIDVENKGAGSKEAGSNKVGSDRKVGNEEDATGLGPAATEAVIEPVRATATPTGHPRRITLRVLAFIAAFLAVIAGAAATVNWFANRSYFVGLDANQIVIYHGQPGGLLWFSPRVAQRTGVSTTRVLPSRIADLQKGVKEPSLDAARGYVSNLVQEARSLPSSGSATTLPAPQPNSPPNP